MTEYKTKIASDLEHEILNSEIGLNLLKIYAKNLKKLHSRSRACFRRKTVANDLIADKKEINDMGYKLKTHSRLQNHFKTGTSVKVEAQIKSYSNKTVQNEKDIIEIAISGTVLKKIVN